MSRNRAITIDLDDTLWDCHPVIREAESKLWEWLETNYPKISDNYTQEMAADLRKKVVKDYPKKSHDYKFLRRSVLRTIFLTSGYDQKFAEDAFDFFDMHRNNVTLFEGAIETLELLSSKFRVIALTNGNADLVKIGINHLFFDVIHAADFGYAKPDIKIFNEAIRRSGVNKKDIYHVGDHPVNDIVGAQKAGLRTIWMNPTGISWPENSKEPDYTIEKITLLQDILMG